MGSIQSVDPKSVFSFVGDFNCHHSEWLGESITDAHGVGAFDFATVTNCSQLVNGPTHRRVSKGGGGIWGMCPPPPLSLMPNEEIYGD